MKPTTIPIAAVDVIAAAKPWHYWVGVIFAITALAVTAIIGLGYVFKVAALRYYPPGHPEYPKRVPMGQRPAIGSPAASRPSLTDGSSATRATSADRELQPVTTRR